MIRVSIRTFAGASSGGACYALAVSLAWPGTVGAQEGTPTGACCFGTLGTACLLKTDAACAPWDYLGDGVPCSPNPCHGACCLPDATCQMLPRGICESDTYAGVFLGYSPCESIECPPVGACCIQGGCVNSRVEECLNPGEFLPGTLCSETDCTGLCCLGGWDAIRELTREECEGAPYYGDFAGSGTDDGEITNCSSLCCHSDGRCEWTPFFATVCPDHSFFYAGLAPEGSCEAIDCSSLKFGACCTPNGCTLRTPELCVAGEYLGDNVQCLWAHVSDGSWDCPPPCSADADCDDGQFCTMEWCGPYGYCESERNECEPYYDCSNHFARCRQQCTPPMNIVYDESGAVNLVDWKSVSACMTGPEAEVSAPCDCADGSPDGHVDLRDIKAMLFRFQP